jgi:hypothetical protein
MAAAREARGAAEQRQEEEERARAATVARVCEHQYPLPSFSLVKDIQQHRCHASEGRRRRRLETGNHGGATPSTDAPSTSSAGNSGGYY